MRPSVPTFVAVVILDATVIVAIPMINSTINSLYKGSEPCNNPSVSGVDPSCWDTLGMTQYTQTWYAAHKDICDTPSNFSSCFWEIQALSSMDCTAIEPSACSFPMSKNFTAKDFYIAYNIYGINQVFNSYWRGMGNANGLAAERVGAIVELLDPPKRSSVLVNEILIALAAGLQFLNVLSVAGVIKAIVVANQQSPQVFRNLMKVGTTQTQVAQMSDLSNSVSDVVQQYQQNIARSLPPMVNDVNTFISLAGTGQFQVNPLPDISSASDELLVGLQTYVISRALTANNIIITRANATDIHSMATTTDGGLAYTTGCEGGYDHHNVCGPFWYDKSTNTTYSLNNLGSMGDSYASLFQQIFSNWTTPELLLRGAAECAALGGSKGQIDQYFVQGTTFDPACLSNTQMCSWNLNSLDVDHEFADCPTQNGYLVNGCTGHNGCGGEDSGVNVPSGYIGLYLTNPPTSECVCNS
jgi:hypothetical protein